MGQLQTGEVTVAMFGGDKEAARSHLERARQASVDGSALQSEKDALVRDIFAGSDSEADSFEARLQRIDAGSGKQYVDALNRQKIILEAMLGLKGVEKYKDAARLWIELVDLELKRHRRQMAAIKKLIGAYYSSNGRPDGASINSFKKEYEGQEQANRKERELASQVNEFMSRAGV